MHPERSLYQGIFGAMSLFTQYLVSPLYVPLLKVSLWPLGSPLAHPTRTAIGIFCAVVAFIISFRVERVEKKLARIEVKGFNIFDFSNDYNIRPEEREVLYRHPFSPNSPEYGMGKIIVKTVLVLLATCGREFPVVVSTVRMFCGVGMLYIGWCFDPFYSSWINALQSGADSGILTVYADPHPALIQTSSHPLVVV